MHGTLSVNINGEDKPVRLNNHFIFELGTLLKCDPLEAPIKLMEVAAKNPMIGFTYILYCGLIGAQYEQANFAHGIDIKEISLYASTTHSDNFAPIWETFKEVMQIPDAPPEQVEEYAATVEAEKKS